MKHYIRTLFTSSLLAIGACCSLIAQEAAKEAAKEASQQEGLINWQTDYEQAKKMSKEQSKPLFVFFTGSDWCPWCMRMDKEILSTSDFQKALADKMIFVKVDFPRSTKLPAKTIEQNEALKKQFAVKGVPTVFILDPNLNTIVTMSYKPGGGQAYANEVQNLLDSAAKKK